MAIVFHISSEKDIVYASTLVDWYIASSTERGTGIAIRTESYLISKIVQGDAILALKENELVGFCYIETFESKKYVSNSGLIIKNEFRGLGLATKVKINAFNLARNKYPDSKIFGITTSNIVMGINTKLGYRPVTFSQLTSDDAFWSGCSSCPNYDILKMKDKKMCLCTGMLALSKNELQDIKDENKNESNKAK